MSDELVITVKGLRKSFGKLEVLKGIDLSVRKGTMLALLGPNGAGKTTTVRILATLLAPDSGEVRVNGYDVVEEADEVRGTIGLTGQYAAVDEYLTGRENLEMMGRLYHLGKTESRRRAEELLVQFDLLDAAERTAKTYSGGMRRRLDLAASLVAVPSIVFLDEPTTGLDPRSRLAMWRVIEQLMQDGTTILLTTQYLEEADKLADRIAVIDHGRVIAEGTADELKALVGQERLELTIAESSDFNAAAAALKEEGVKADLDARTLNVPANQGVGDIKRILDRMESVGAHIESLSLHKPTLDDVFLHLTGREAAGSEENEQTKP